MKILIMGFAKVKYMPYMHFYLGNLRAEENDVHLLYWNRDLCEEDLSALSGVTLHEFRCKQDDDVPKAKKLGSFRKYRRYAKSLLKRGAFDLVIVLHSMPGVLLHDVLCKSYRGRFIFDYRDYTFEGFLPYRAVIASLVRASRATFVSSDAFRRFLPGSESARIFTSHNLLRDSLDHREEKEQNGTSSDKIRIAFWGIIRHEELNRTLIGKIASDARFELHYYGREQQVALRLKSYAAEIGAQNVFFHGEYRPTDRYEFVRHTDIIHNLYRDGNMMFAMANKYYDGIIFKIPQLCTPDSFMAKAATAAGVGFALDPEDADFLDRLYTDYTALDRTSFCECCDRELARVLVEYRRGDDLIRSLTDPKGKG